MTSLPSSLPNKREQLLLTTKSIKRARVENSFPNVADSSKARKHRAPDARRSMSNISMPVINPNSTSNSLQLNVSVVGLDTSEAWSYINSSWPPEEDIWGAFRYPGPVYVVVDVLGGDRSGFDVGYSVDGKEAHCGTAVSNGSLFCSYSYNSGLAVQVARRVTYEGRERILFYATTSTTTWTEGWTPAHAPDASTLSSCSNLLVWVCKNETIPDSIPYNVTELNLAQTLSTWSDPRPSPPFSNGLGLLEPGPMVRVNIVLSKRPSARQLSDIRQRLCEAAIWNLTDPGDSDRCEWQLWVELMEGANGEKWDDGARQWIPCGKYDFVEGRAGMELWTVSVTSLMSSNNNASLARNLINTEINSASFISTFQVAAVINVTISGDNGARTGNKLPRDGPSSRPYPVSLGEAGYRRTARLLRPASRWAVEPLGETGYGWPWASCDGPSGRPDGLARTDTARNCSARGRRAGKRPCARACRVRAWTWGSRGRACARSRTSEAGSQRALTMAWLACVGIYVGQPKASGLYG